MIWDRFVDTVTFLWIGVFFADLAASAPSLRRNTSMVNYHLCSGLDRQIFSGTKPEAIHARALGLSSSHYPISTCAAPASLNPDRPSTPVCKSRQSTQGGSAGCEILAYCGRKDSTNTEVKPFIPRGPIDGDMPEVPNYERRK